MIVIMILRFVFQYVILVNHLIIRPPMYLGMINRVRVDRRDVAHGLPSSWHHKRMMAGMTCHNINILCSDRRDFWLMLVWQHMVDVLVCHPRESRGMMIEDGGRHFNLILHANTIRCRRIHAQNFSTVASGRVQY